MGIVECANKVKQESLKLGSVEEYLNDKGLGRYAALSAVSQVLPYFRDIKEFIESTEFNELMSPKHYNEYHPEYLRTLKQIQRLLILEIN